MFNKYWLERIIIYLLFFTITIIEVYNSLSFADNFSFSFTLLPHTQTRALLSVDRLASHYFFRKIPIDLL